MDAETSAHPYARIVATLRQRGCRVHVRSAHSVRACCPAHRDQNPSLVVTNDGDRVLMHCFAGCRTADVVLALGLRMADLFSSTPRSRLAPPRVVAVYAYCDLNGVVIAEKVRFEPKAFRWRVPVDTPGGGTRAGLHGATPGLYRWPDLVDAKRVLISEGEKAADHLAALGFIATCPPAGASTWRPVWSADLWRAGCREAIVLADSDRSGRAHALRVAGACYAISAAADEPPAAPDAPWTTWTAPVNITDAETTALRVKILELQTVPGGDVVDWLAAGHSPQELSTLIEAAPYWSPQGVELERAERKRAQNRERQRRFKARVKAARARSRLVTPRLYGWTRGGNAGNAVTHPERTSFFITRSVPLPCAA
jgi:putative DNA primase/helicase